MQGGYNLARFASTLKTKKTNKGPGIAAYFQKERGHCNIVGEVRLHDPVTFSMCLHSDSPLPCNKLMKVKTFIITVVAFSASFDEGFCVAISI